MLLSYNSNVGSTDLAAVLRIALGIESYLLALFQRLETISIDCGKVYEYFFAVSIVGDETITPGGAYDRLKDCVGKILLVGVGHERNTYIHSVEEVLNVPNRLAAEPMELLTILPDGSKKKVYMRKHYNAMQPHISEEFVKLNQAFLDCGVVEEVVFGDAKCLLCDAEKVFRVVRHVLAPDPECLVTKPEIPTERWRGFRA